MKGVIGMLALLVGALLLSGCSAQAAHQVEEWMRPRVVLDEQQLHRLIEQAEQDMRVSSGIGLLHEVERVTIDAADESVLVEGVHITPDGQRHAGHYRVKSLVWCQDFHVLVRAIEIEGVDIEPGCGMVLAPQIRQQIVAFSALPADHVPLGAVFHAHSVQISHDEPVFRDLTCSLGD